MSLSQIRQKKKKEAVRRLSQGSAGTAVSSHGPGQWPQRRKFPDQHQIHRVQPSGTSLKPAKRSHVSPLHQDAAGSGDMESKLIKPSASAGFSFGAAQTAISSQASPFTHSSSDAISSFPTAPGFGAAFPTSTGDANTTSSASSIFGLRFGSTTSTSSITPGPQIASSLLATSQSLNPIFDSGLHKSMSSTALVSSAGTTSTGSPFKLDQSIKQPSTSAIFGSFSNFGSSMSTSVANTSMLSKMVGDASEIKTSGPSLTFGMAGASHEGKSSDSSAVSKPLFPITSKSASAFNTPKLNRPQTRTTGVLGRAFSAATVGLQRNETKEKITEEKIRGLGTTNLTALVIKDIPEVYNKNASLKRFYSRFGEVTKVVCTVARKSATVTFKTHEAADAAKKKGKILRPGLPPVMIFWKQRRRSTTSESDQPNQEVEKPVRKSPEKSTRKISNQIAETDDEIGKRIKSSEVLKDIQNYLQTLEPNENAGEKLQFLEGIDKKLRQVFKRSSDISSAKAVIGTCKDMCPEKERYMREYQRRLSVFEAIPGTGSIDENPQVEHTRAIKEYDRSAADKEEPLPHELRPVPVLKMTMDYLATNIMDLVEGREGEWFDFVWNRTRGIRKDITQQHLCDPECVDLVEKTARFHIICAHLLCEADMHSFDAKINTENLTKCMQTLKQFYGDLYKDKGITCPQEAEFRAYDILLNLNEGDILREVMTFRDEVQKSAEVQFAMAVFHALNSNNFVRFFRLLRNAKYLSACLLHRYFTQVRSRAVQTLNHSLSISKNTTLFPLKDLVDMLAFEDESEAEEFCTHHGLPITDGCVHFARSSFIEPESRFPVKRALRLIGSKRGSSIGEVMYNGVLPPHPQHQPVLSFDDDGHYIGDTDELLSVFCKENIPASQEPDRANVGAFGSVTSTVPFPGRQTTRPDTSDRQLSITSAVSPGASVGVARPLVQIVQRPFTQPPQSPPKVTVVYTAEEITQYTKSLFLEVLNEMCTEITKEALDKVHCCLQLSSEIVDDLHEQALSEFIRETANIVLTEEINKKRIAEEIAAFQERVSRVIHGEVTEDVISLECIRIAEEVIREAQEERLKQAREKASKEICLTLIDEGVLDELQDVSWESLEEEKAERDAKLQQLASQVIRSRTARYFKRWVKWFRTSVHLKGLLSTFPPGAPMMSTEEQLQHLVGHNRHTISMASIRTDSHQREIRESLKRRQAEMDRVRELACIPLDIPTLLADSMRSQPIADSYPLYWKLLISFPEACEGIEFTGNDNIACTTSFVIKEKFKRGVYPVPSNVPQMLKKKIDLLSLYRAEIQSFPTQSKVLKICTKACYGVLTNTEAREVIDSQQFLGASAAMFVVDWQELQLSQQAAREAHFRLRRVLESKPPEPRLPVVVIVIDHENTSPAEADVLSLLGIQQLRSDGLLSECKLYTVHSSFARLDYLSQTLCSAVTWLGRRMFVSSLPKMDNLVNFIEDGLQREFTVTLSEDLFVRKQAKLDQQCPEVIIELYNSVLDHLAAVVSSNSLQRLSWPISEFTDGEKLNQGVPHVTWNSEENLQKLRSCITTLKLPLPPPAAVDGTWESESELCMEYARSLSPNATALLNRVKWILARAKRVLDEINFLSASPSLSAAKVPWPLVLDACVNFRLTPLHSDPGLAEQDVYYLEEELNAFVQPTLWRQSANMSKEEAAKAENKIRLETTRPRKSKDTKLHESYLEVEQQLDKIKGASHAITTLSPHITSLFTPSPIVTPICVTPSVEIESSSTTSDSAIQATSERLQAVVEQAKLESKRFEDLLKKALGDGDSLEGLGQKTWRKRKAQSLGESKKSPKFIEGLNVPDIDVSFGALEESLSCFNETLKSQRRSDHYTERRLRECLES